MAVGVAARCDGCIGFHTKALVELGASTAEVNEALGVAIYMGGGPSAMYAANAVAAFNEFFYGNRETRTVTADGMFWHAPFITNHPPSTNMQQSDFVTTLFDGKGNPNKVTVAFTMALNALLKGHTACIILMVEAVELGRARCGKGHGYRSTRRSRGRSAAKYWTRAGASPFASPAWFTTA